MDVHGHGDTPIVSPQAQREAEPPQRTRPLGRARAMGVSGETMRQFATQAWPLLLTVIAGVTSLLTLLGLFYDRFPALRPVEPTEVRRVEVTNAAIVEHRSMLPDQVPVEVVFFQADAVGYDTDDITVATLWLDAATLQRAEPELQKHAEWTTFTRSDRIVGWLDVRYPVRRPEGSSGCLFVRVFLYPTPEDRATPSPDRLTQTAMLAYADTSPVDLYNLNGTACEGVLPMAPSRAELRQDNRADSLALSSTGR